MAKIYITSKEIIKILNISDKELLKIEKFFDSIPDDKWELVENKDYKIVSQDGLREYTESGAYTIARYLEATKKKGFWDLIKEWIFHTKENIRKGFVKRKILENSSSLVKRRNQFWISRTDVIAIFGTHSNYLSKVADYASKKNFSLIEGTDFDDFEGDLYFSLPGILKLSQAFAECLTKKNRKEECKDVGEVINPQINNIVDLIRKREDLIESSKSKAKRRDKQTCQVTKQKGNKISPIPVAAHHLYSRNDYPLLATSLDNLITITCDVHNQFHDHYMGGKSKPCTIDDFIYFVEQYYPQNTEVVVWLHQQKMMLGKQQPLGKNKPPHVLYLPYKRVSD